MDTDSQLEGSSQIWGGIIRSRKPVTYVTPSNGTGDDPLLDEFIPRGPSSAQVYSALSLLNVVQQLIEDMDLADPWSTYSSWNPISSGESIDNEAKDINAFLCPYRTDSIFHTGAYNNFASGQLAQTYSSGSTDYTVKALVGPDRYRIKYRIDALPDTGAKRNFVSQQLVDSIGLVPMDLTKEKFRLPSGATIKSCGTVNISFTFCGETEHHLLNCCILPKCTHDLILCQSFLKVMGTLTKYAHRITKSLRNLATRIRFNLIEDDTCCFQGSFDDIPSFALADTGCDVMLISTNFAIRNSLEVDGNSEHRRTIEYADGSLDTTAGIVHGATWQFRSSWDKITCNFYVLDNLKADIVFSNHFIFEHNVFLEFEEDIVDTSLVPGPDFGDIYNIRLISHYSSALQNLEASAIADMNSPGSFSPEAIKNERVRRDQIRDAINALPLDQQDQARIDERNRQEIWDGYRRRHFETEGGPIFVIHQVMVDRKQRWWRNRPFWSRLKRRVTKSMLWL